MEDKKVSRDQHYAFFIGCTIPVRARHYELSMRQVVQAFGITLVDLPDFTCCGFPVNSMHRKTSILMAARNLSIAESAGLNICTMCNACTSILSEVNWLMKNDPKSRDYIESGLAQLGREYNGGVQVKHCARILYEDVGVDRLKAAVKRDLSDLEFASHYGCHYLKPSEFYGGFDAPEDPKSLDVLVSAVGASPVDYEGSHLLIRVTHNRRVEHWYAVRESPVLSRCQNLFLPGILLHHGMKFVYIL